MKNDLGFNKQKQIIGIKARFSLLILTALTINLLASYYIAIRFFEAEEPFLLVIKEPFLWISSMSYYSDDPRTFISATSIVVAVTLGSLFFFTFAG
jgi:hypothetical protein